MDSPLLSLSTASFIFFSVAGLGFRPLRNPSTVPSDTPASQATEAMV